MSLDVMTLALAKSYADQHGGGGGASTAGDFIIKMTVTSDDDGNYTVTSCDATFEQIDAAYNADKNIVLKVATSGYQGDGYYSLPVVSAAPGNYYYFCGLDDLYVYLAVFNPDYSEFSVSNFSANNITYSNTALPTVENVKTALDELVTKSHTHANKDTLDKLSDSNGKLQYNGSDVGLKGEKGDKGDPGAPGKDGKDGTNGITPTIGDNGNWYLGTTDTGKPSRGEKGDTGAAGADGKTPVKGTDYWTEIDKAEIVANTLAALPKWTGGSY